MIHSSIPRIFSPILKIYLEIQESLNLVVTYDRNRSLTSSFFLPWFDSNRCFCLSIIWYRRWAWSLYCNRICWWVICKWMCHVILLYNSDLLCIKKNTFMQMPTIISFHWSISILHSSRKWNNFLHLEFWLGNLNASVTFLLGHYLVMYIYITYVLYWFTVILQIS